jgi:hypothetical protein
MNSVTFTPLKHHHAQKYPQNHLSHVSALFGIGIVIAMPFECSVQALIFTLQY